MSPILEATVLIYAAVSLASTLSRGDTGHAATYALVVVMSISSILWHRRSDRLQDQLDRERGLRR